MIDANYIRVFPCFNRDADKKILAGNVTELFHGVVRGRNEFETSSLDPHVKFERNRWSNCLIDSRCPEDSAVKEIAPGKIRAGIVIVGNRNNQLFRWKHPNNFWDSRFRRGLNCSTAEKFRRALLLPCFRSCPILHIDLRTPRSMLCNYYDDALEEEIRQARG